MHKILKSEWLKQKASSDKKLLFFIPFLSLFIALLFAGPMILESFSIYWWEGLFLFTLLGLLFLYDYKSEGHAGHFQNIYLGKETFRIFLVKIALKIKDSLIASLLFIGILYAVSLLFSGMMTVNFLLDIISLLLILLASVWVLPILYFLSKWFNPYLLVVGNSLMCLLIAPLVAQTSVWYLFPYTYHYKVAYHLLHLKPSGDVERVTSNLIDFQSLSLALLLAVALFMIALLLLRGRLYRDQLSKK